MNNVKNFLLKSLVFALIFITVLTPITSAYTNTNWSLNKNQFRKTNDYGFNRFSHDLAKEKFQNWRDYNFNNMFDRFTDFSKIDFSSINWNNPYLDIDWENVDFSNVDWENIDWSNVDLDKIDFSKIDWSQIDLGDVNLDQLENLDLNEIFSNVDWENILNNIDWKEFLKNLDLKELLEKIDLEKIFEKIDFDNIDLDKIFGDINFDEIFGDINFDEIFGDINFGDIGLGGGIPGNKPNSALPVPESLVMESVTAPSFAGDKYKVQLHANVYLNGDSTKWALLIHPFMMKGTAIANTIGDAYYEKGYNVIAPDLRGFGESEGKVALGFLESLDMYDWLCALQNYNPTEIIVHGISLGGATTNFLSGIDGFMENAPAEINMNQDFYSLEELGVVALVEDCGYTDMTEFQKKKFLIDLGIGLDENNFDYYSKATNSLKYCNLPVLVIHGTNDTMVKPKNADVVAETVQGPVSIWKVKGASHAFVMLGKNVEDYKQVIKEYIDTL